MKCLVWIFIFNVLFFGCAKEKKLEIIEHFYSEKESENIEREIEYFYSEGKEIPNEREKIISLLHGSGDKLLNINNLFEIKIPKSIEIVTLNQYLFMDIDCIQYSISNYLGIIFQNKYFVISIDCFGETNKSILTGCETYNLRTITNPSIYKSKNQVKYLKENYLYDSFINENKIEISKFISSWGSGRTSDYYGLYFKLTNKEFSECVISIDNIWGTFAKNESMVDLSEKNYKEKSTNERHELEQIFKELDIMENSITFTRSDNSLLINNGSVGEEIITDLLIFPTIDNLRMRSRPSLNGEILGNMRKIIYRIITKGEEIEIDGIKGNWIMVIPFNGNSASWVFSGYTRKATSEEYDYFYGG